MYPWVTPLYRIKNAVFLHTAEALTVLLAEIFVHFIGSVDEIVISAVPKRDIILLVIQRDRMLFNLDSRKHDDAIVEKNAVNAENSLF